MQLSDALHILAVVLLVVVVLFVAFLLATSAVRNRDNAKVKVDESRTEIASCRKKRHELIKQMLAMFGSGNPQKANLEKLYALYPKANTDEREREWEKKYIPVMQAFMAYAQTHARPEVAGSWQMANQSIVDNEAKLTNARNVYVGARETLDAYMRTPRSYAISFGDFVLHLTKQYDTMKSVQQQQDGGDGNGTE